MERLPRKKKKWLKKFGGLEYQIRIAKYKKSISAPTINDYMDFMSDLRSANRECCAMKILAICDENGNSEFVDNFYKEVQKQAKEYGK